MSVPSSPSSTSAAALRLDRDAPAAALALSGTWTLAADLSAANAFLADPHALDGLPSSTLRVADAGIAAWESPLLVFLRRLAVAAPKGTTLDLSGLPSGVRALLDLASAVPPRARDAAPPEPSWLARVGLASQACFQHTGESLRFLVDLAASAGRMLVGKGRHRRADFLDVLSECGPGALPILFLMSLLVGMIVAFLGAIQLKLFGAEIFIADAVAIAMTREMGALMTGIVMSGRTGAAFAARLGTMQVNEEIDALRTLGFSPMDYLVAPRALALLLMMPLLATYSMAAGILGGAIAGIATMDLTPAQYLHETLSSMSVKGIASGLFKAAVYGVVIAVSGCRQGIACGRSAESVGTATTAAVVNAIVWIIVMDSLISVLYMLLGI